MCNKGVVGPTHHNGPNGENVGHVDWKRQGLNVTFDNTKKKAIECYNHLKKKETGPVPEFNANTGWFYKFKTHYGFHNVKRSGEATRADEDAAASYPDRLMAIIEERGVQAPADF